MASVPALPQPENTVIGGDLKIPRMITGLWQLAGGHERDGSFEVATTAMDALYAFLLLWACNGSANGITQNIIRTQLF